MKLTIAGDSAANQSFAPAPGVGTATIGLPSHPTRASEAADARAMRVLHVGKFYLPYRGGIESHLHALCRELTKSISVNVVVANETLRLMTSEINEVKVRRLPRLFSLSATPVCPTLPGEIRRADADIVLPRVDGRHARAAHRSTGRGRGHAQRSTLPDESRG